MKRILLFLLIVMSSVVTSCESIGVDADAMPVTLEIFVKDTEGNNLLDYGWLDGKNVTATFKGETYRIAEGCADKGVYAAFLRIQGDWP